ncbi:hypothetical protein LCGC14_1141940 [marine sediment metagenome]|uniref:LamG domain-containing protein n=1 Tax=marine sediment metagenome TaxID=412755 RepID=A0A0F9ML19_9ZZZZ
MTRLRRASYAGQGGVSLNFDGSVTYVACGSDASIDNLPTAGVLTVDGYFRTSQTDAQAHVLVQKGNHTASGWKIVMIGTFRVSFELVTDDTHASIRPSSGAYNDGVWHHWASFYDDGGDRKPHLAIDGVWNETGQITATGTYVSDASVNLMFGRIPNVSAQYWKGDLGWHRLSNSDRFDGATQTNFSPPGRIDPPAIDGDTVEQWDYRDGRGLAVVASVTAANDGAITLGAGEWRKD